MDKLPTNSESNIGCNLKASNTFSNNFNSSTSNIFKLNSFKSINLKLSTVKNFNKETKHNSKIKIFPGIIEKKDLLLNKNKTLLNVKELISNKIRTLKGLAEDKKEKKFNNKLSQQLCENKYEINSEAVNVCKITNQQIFIQSNNKNNNDNNEIIVDFNSNIIAEDIDDELEKCKLNYQNNNENGDVIEIKNKFLGSSKLRNTTPLIDNESELKRLHLNQNNHKNNNNNNNELLFSKNESQLDFKNKTSDNFFIYKNRSKNFSIISSSQDNKTELKRERAKSNQFINRGNNSNNNRTSLKNKSAGSLSEFNIKNFNPESQVYFNSEFFQHVDNLYPIYRKKDYFLEPSKKLNWDSNKTKSIGNFGFFPNRKNNNSILYKMKNSVDALEINRNIYSSGGEANKVSFNFMNPQIMDFFDFEGEINHKRRRSFEKHQCSGSFKNQDENSKKDKLDSFRTQIKYGSGLTNNNNNNGERMNFNKTSFNLRSEISNNNAKQVFKNKTMNGDLTCFSNIKIYKNINERVEKAKISSSEDKQDIGSSDRNINEMNSNKFNSQSNTFSDPSDHLIKSKNGVLGYKEKNLVYNQEENYYGIENQNEAKGKMNLNRNNNNNNRDNSDNMDFQALNINLNFSQISSEEIHNQEAKSKRKSALMDFENENNLFHNKQNSKNKSGSKAAGDLDNYYELTRNSNDNFNGYKEKNENSYYALSLNKMKLGEINNPLIIKKYEIKNLEKGNMLRLSNGKIAYLPFQKSFNVEKIHFNFSNRSNLKNSNNENYNQNINCFNATGGMPKNNYNPGKTDGFNNFDNFNKSKRLIILKK